MKINDILKIGKVFHLNSSSDSHGFDTLIGLLSILGTPILKGNEVGNMHAIRFGLLFH